MIRDSIHQHVFFSVLPLLLHKHTVRGIIDNFASKDILGHVIISFSSRGKVLLCIEDKLIAISTQADCNTLANHIESENIAILGLTISQELDGITEEKIM